MSDEIEYSHLLHLINEFEAGSFSPKDAGDLLGQILGKLFASEGFSLTHTDGPGDRGIDFIANTEETVIGIQQKHFSQKHAQVSMSTIHEAVGTGLFRAFSKIIVFSNRGFAKSARDLTQTAVPKALELLDVDGLKAWAARLGQNSVALRSTVSSIISNMSKELALMIARKPNILEEIEWRDLERILAEVFSKLGFRVELTPPSKDGGKDIILECRIQGQPNIFLVEIKHWPSGKVGSGYLKEFLRVILSEKAEGGVFLATYGYSNNAFEQLTEIERNILKFGNKTKIVALCRSYQKITSGIWKPSSPLSELLFDDTF